MFKIYLSLLLTSYFLVVMESCKKDLTPVTNDQSEIKLTVEDVGVTEAWLRLNIQNPGSKNQITITRNDSVIRALDASTLQPINSSTELDTLIYDSGLLTNHDYTYTAIIDTDNQPHITDQCSLTTLDTTSHDFTWDIITIGDGNGCSLNDICIINENDIWAVGEIHTNETDRFDSLGNWIEPYNVVHWDGTLWELMRYKYYLPYFQEPHWFRIDGIYALSQNDIWFANGIVHHYDSSYYNQHEFVKSYSLWDMGVLRPDDGGIKKLWGTTLKDLYGAGDKGTIVHYYSQTWQRIESGTDVDLTDVFGYEDQISGTNYQLFSGFEYDGVPDEGMILKYEEDQIKIIDNGIDGIISSEFRNDFASVWTDSYYNFWVTSAGDVFKLVKTGRNIYKRIMMLDGFRGIHRIRGTGANDIFVAGFYVKLRHFNGKSWFHYSELDDAQISLKSLDFKDNIVAAIGGDRIYLGVRNNY